MKCAAMTDIERFASTQQQGQNHELETERLADEIVGMTLSELFGRLLLAYHDADRKKTDRRRLNDIATELHELITECSEYRV